MTDCKNCSYRLALARKFDIHVWGEDCDKYGTDFCRQVNYPICVPNAQTINVKRPSNLDIHSYGERKDNG